MNLFGSDGSTAAGTTESVAAFVVYLFLWVVVGLVVSVIITFYFSANTIIYSLLRNKVDNAALDEVYLDSDDLGISSTATVSCSEQTRPQSKSDNISDSPS